MADILKTIRYFAYRAKYRYARHLNLTVPVDVSMELASLCNQRCGYCYHADQKNLPFKPGIMPLHTATKIIDEAAALGVQSIKFNYRGESTLSPNFETITAYAKAYASGSTFIDRLTNSNFKFAADREDIFHGLCNQTKVKVSFDSFIPEVMEEQRAGSIHALAMKNIDRFYNHPLRKNTEIVIQAVRTKLNKDEDIEGQVKRRWPEAGVSVRDMVGGRVEKDLSALENRVRGQGRKSCIQAHARLIFDINGKAQPCCPDIGSKINLGDINKQSLYSIFNGLPAKWLRQDLKTGEAFKSNPCKTCSSFESYEGYSHGWNS